MSGNNELRNKNDSGLQDWKLVCSLNKKRELVFGSDETLSNAIRRGADLRIYTEFRHSEHIDRTSKNPELVQEVSDFRVTYLMENRWVAGIMNLRQPVALMGEGFGPRPSMSFFMYNQNGLQSIARPHLDGLPIQAQPDFSLNTDPNSHYFDWWDGETNAPSHNFVYDFETYQFMVHDIWKEVFSHEDDGTVISGSVEDLARECASGRDVKVAIRGLCSDLLAGSDQNMEHEVFVHVGSNYFYTEQKLFWGGTQPVVRVRPSIPIRYESKNWNFGWLLVRTDGHVARWLVDPYTLKFKKSQTRHAIRWFVR